MISSRQPTFAKIGPKLERASRELESLDAFLAAAASLPDDARSAWGRATVVAAAVANSYNGLEDALATLARDVDGSVPTGDASHQDLLDQMRAPIEGVRPAVLDESLHALMTELKGFRHRVRHNYGFDLDPARCEENLARLRAALPMVRDAVRALERALARAP